MSLRVAAIVLAAGGARRFGGPKLLAEVEGTPLVTRVVDAALDADLDPVLVVLGHFADRVRRALGDRRVREVPNPDPDAGLSGSVARGIEALEAGIAGALFVPADQPWLRAADLDRSVTAFRSGGGRQIVVPVSGGRRGAPVLFPADLFPRLQALEGDRGGRALLPLFSERVLEIEILDPRALRDVDVPADLPTE